MLALEVGTCIREFRGGILPSRVSRSVSRVSDGQKLTRLGYGGHTREPSRTALPPPGLNFEIREREIPADPRVVLGRDTRDGLWV